MSEAGPDPIRALLDEASAHGAGGRFVEAERSLLAALRELDQRGEEDSPLRAYALYSLRCCYMNLRRFPETLSASARELELLERHFGPEDPRLAEPVEAAALAHYYLSHWDPAVQGFERAITLYRRGGPTGEPLAARALGMVGRCFQRQGRHAEAETRFRESLASFERCEAPSEVLADALYHLGTVVALQDRPGEAEPLLVRALTLLQSQPDASVALEALILDRLVRTLEVLRRLPEAEAFARRAVARTEVALPEGHPARAEALSALGRILSQQDRASEMLPILERALREAESAYGPSSPYVAGALHNLAGCHFRAGRLEEAAALAERAVSVYEQQPDSVQHALANSLRSLAMVRERQGRGMEAAELMRRASALGPQVGADESGVLGIPLPNRKT